MRARDLAYETASALDSNRVRSLLTVLGIVIGISAVIAMTALIGGIKQSLIGELGLNQARMVYMYVWPDRDVTLDDLEAIHELLPEYEYMAASTYAGTEAKSADKTFNASVEGVLPEYFNILGMKVRQGSLLTQRDEDESSLVVVLDQGAVRQLYGSPDEEVVGETIMLDNVSYTIIGVLDSGTSAMGNSGTIYMPFSTCAQRLSGYWGVNDITALAREGSDMAQLAETTKQRIAAYFGMDEEDAEENMYVQTMQSIIDEVNATMASFQILMTSVASISLLVGGIGIMNMMLTNVTERIREIGLRKALGARRSDITKQFLLESVCLCIAGGIIGIILGYLGSFALTGLAGGLMYGDGASVNITPAIDVGSVLMATGICVAIGIIFGYYPARQAAKLDPVESLHYQ